jgi:hypothetical protein
MSENVMMLMIVIILIIFVFIANLAFIFYCDICSNVLFFMKTWILHPTIQLFDWSLCT